MNNNMPNNFNNGGNNPMGNGVPNPVENAAKQDLMGGQNAVGNSPSVMQGMPNVQNGPGAMQGVGAVPNTPNIMQGGAAPKPAPAVGMPGQEHSGINAMTMQKEEAKKDSPEVVSIPNFASNIPEPPAAQPGVIQTPNPVSGPTPGPMPSPNPNPNPVLGSNLGPMPGPTPNPSVSMPNQIGNPTNPLNNTINMSNVNEPKPPVSPAVPNAIGGNVIGGPIPNSIGQVNNQTMNGAPSDNMNQMNRPQNTIGMVPPAPNNGPKDLNDIMPSINAPGINTGASQIGTADTSPLDNDMVEMPDMPEKKFPLSTREMILIGIALVGIVAVIIMYT